jgi:glutamyl-tRNA synthetase
LSDAFVNYLALLGWSPEGDEEMIPLSRMIKEFRLEDVSHSPAFFDVKKLSHINGEYIRKLSAEQFIEISAPWVRPWDTAWQPTDREVPWTKEDFNAELFAKVAPLVQERIVLLGEIPAMVDFFFHDQPVMDDAAFTKAIKNDVVAQQMIKAAITRFADVTWEAATLHEEVAALGEGLGLVLRKAQAPIRCAVTGALVGPPLFESLELLGRENTIARLKRALELAS